MKNIQKIKERYVRELAKKHYKLNYDLLDNKQKTYCSCLAECWAYIYSIIPEDFRKSTIFGFTGISKNGNSLSPDIAINAKNIVCEYCWGLNWEKIKKNYNEDKKIRKVLRHKSKMMERLKNGNNIAIYGESDEPVGRTLIASIVMKEAIKVRMKPGRRGQTYDWVDFDILKQALKDDSYDLADYRSCDWLVVDNIDKRGYSASQKAFIADLISPFFLGRLADKLPTILVFRFNLDSQFSNLNELLGTGISSMVNNNKTYKIPLSKVIKHE